MASKNKPVPRAPWEVDFVHIELASTDKEALKTWDKNFSTTEKSISDLCMGGCKLSVVYDGRNDCYICTLTTQKVEAPAHQQCVSARGPDMLSSMRALAYKYAVILGGDITLLGSVAESRSQWG